MSDAPRWRAQPERGSALGVELLVVMTDTLGREAVGCVLWPVCLYFALFDAVARRASTSYLQRMQRRADLWGVVAHLHAFAWAAADRYLFLAGRSELFELHSHGSEHMQALAARAGGALFLGSHLGSFEAMRAMASRYSLPLTIVADFGNARRINGVFSQLHPHLTLDVIEHQPDSGLWMIDVKARTDAGRVVAMLADRAPAHAEPSGRAAALPRAVRVDFLGGKAWFPTGPFVLAHFTKTPLYAVFALFDGARRYDLYCEPLAERVELPRHGRTAALTTYVQRYADRVAEHARRAPLNWFNFYDFWQELDAEEDGR